MDALQVIQFLYVFGFNPALWWMWESVGLFLYFILKWTRGLGADKYIVLQWTGAGFRKVGEKWVKKFAKSYGKHKGRTPDPTAVVYSESGFLSEHGVVFTDTKHTLPMKVTLEVLKHNPVGKRVLTKNGEKFVPAKDYTVNPSVEAMETHIGHETAKQLNIANAINHPGMMILIMVGLLGALAMAFAYPFIFPYHATVTTALNNATAGH